MWEIYAYHNSESLFGIFNAVAAMMGSSSYLGALAAVVFCGFVVAMVAYVVAPEKLQGWKWLGTVVLVSSVMFIPRVNVGIVDKTGGAPVKVVANVPFAMAALGGLTSTIGNSLTELAETAFQVIPGPASLPAELAYQQNGLMFGSRMIQETRSVTLPDPSVRTDLMNFVSNCTAYDIADGTIPADAFSKSDNLWSTMASTNPARFSIVTTPAGVTTNTCDQVYASINGRMPAQVDELSKRLGIRLNPSLPAAMAQAAVLNQITQGYIRSQIAASSATAADIIRQNAIINAINDAGEMGCQRVNDPSCMMLATGRAASVAGQNAAWINGAKISAEALPIVRNGAESLCYAIFPLIVLLLFLTSGKHTVLLLSGYATVLISIQLWPPLFAILNYMATLAAQTDQAAAAEVGAGVKALALQTASPIYSNSISAQAVVSYLIIGIPYLAWSLSNRLVNFGSTLFGGLQGLQSTIGNQSAAAAAGNASLGNVSMDQRVVSPMTSNPFVSKTQDVHGNWTTEDGTGRRAISLLKNEGITSHQVTARVSASDVESAGKAASAAASDVVSASSAQAVSLTEAFSRARNRSSASRSSAGTGLSGYQEVSKAAEGLASEARRISAATGIGEDQVAGTLLRFSAMPSAYGIGGGGTIEKRYGAKLSADEHKVLDQANSDTYRAARAFGDRATSDRAFLNTLSAEGQSGRSLASSLSKTASTMESAERRFNEAVQYSEETRRSFERGETITRDIARDPAFVDAVLEHERAAAQYGANTQSLAAYLSSRLGNYSLTPTHLNSGSALPGGFDEVRAIGSGQRSDVAVNPDLPRLKASNDSNVANRPLTDPPAPPLARPVGEAPMPKTVDGAPGELANPTRFRQDVGDGVDGKQSQVQGSYQGFDGEHELTRTPDGRVVGHRSMVKQTVESLGTDAEAAMQDGAAQALKRTEEMKARMKDSEFKKAIDATPEIPPMMGRLNKRK
jgi:conjugal transfer mating pair stabilization protein TraG